MTGLARFDSKFVVNPESGCWEWTAARDENGCGRFGKTAVTFS